MSEKLIVSWEEYNKTVEKLAIQIEESNYKPTILIAIPVIVGRVAFVIPEANALAFPVPKNETTSNTSIIPVTVPKRPKTGHNAIRV